jgi:N-acetylglutamate synthase-like GNAT family acetyltransferase
MLIRHGREDDRQTIEELLAFYQMNGDIDPGKFHIAEVDGQVVGAVQLEWAGGEAYLRSMVVSRDWHGEGIGSALVKSLIKEESLVKVVSRGYSAPFYRQLGFQAVDWAAIDLLIRQECEICPDRTTCQPEPMVWQSTVYGFDL